jgi:hypothetical protein
MCTVHWRRDTRAAEIWCEVGFALGFRVFLLSLTAFQGQTQPKVAATVTYISDVTVPPALSTRSSSGATRAPKIIHIPPSHTISKHQLNAVGGNSASLPSQDFASVYTVPYALDLLPALPNSPATSNDTNRTNGTGEEFVTAQNSQDDFSTATWLDARWIATVSFFFSKFISYFLLPYFLCTVPPALAAASLQNMFQVAPLSAIRPSSSWEPATTPHLHKISKHLTLRPQRPQIPEIPYSP